jgi:hypothetical protein
MSSSFHELILLIGKNPDSKLLIFYPLRVYLSAIAIVLSVDPKVCTWCQLRSSSSRIVLRLRILFLPGAPHSRLSTNPLLISSKLIRPQQNYSYCIFPDPSLFISTLPPLSSFSQPPPLQFTLAPKQNYRLPARYDDVNPEPLRLLEEEDEQPTAALLRLCLIVRNRLRTATNSFGLLQEYLYRPSFDPDCFVLKEDLHQVGGTDPILILPPSPSPVYRNESVEMLMNWKESGTSTKSDAEVNRFVNGVLDPNFKLEDLQGFNVARENRQSDTVEKKSPFFDSFQMADINIEVPSGTSGITPGTFSIPGLVYRKLTAVIQAAFSSPLASHFHLSPFKIFYVSPSGKEERYTEVCNSDAFIEERNNVWLLALPLGS